MHIDRSIDINIPIYIGCRQHFLHTLDSSKLHLSHQLGIHEAPILPPLLAESVQNHFDASRGRAPEAHSWLIVDLCSDAQTHPNNPKHQLQFLLSCSKSQQLKPSNEPSPSIHRCRVDTSEAARISASAACSWARPSPGRKMLKAKHGGRQICRVMLSLVTFKLQRM